MATGTKKKAEYELTGQDLADILSSALSLLRDSGHQVGLRDVPQKNSRPAGVMIYISNLAVNDDGSLRGE